MFQDRLLGGCHAYRPIGQSTPRDHGEDHWGRNLGATIKLPDSCVSLNILFNALRRFIGYETGVPECRLAAGVLGGCYFVTPTCYAHSSNMLISLVGGKVACVWQVGIVETRDTTLVTWTLNRYRKWRRGYKALSRCMKIQLKNPCIMQYGSFISHTFDWFALQIRNEEWAFV